MTPNPKKKRIGLSQKEWLALVDRVFLRDLNICQACGRFQNQDYIAAHHVRTVGSGGDDSEYNLISLCKGCHNKVHSGSLNGADGARYRKRVRELKKLRPKT